MKDKHSPTLTMTDEPDISIQQPYVKEKRDFHLSRWITKRAGTNLKKKAMKMNMNLSDYLERVGLEEIIFIDENVRKILREMTFKNEKHRY